MNRDFDNPDKYGVEAKGDRAKFVEFLRSIMAEALRVLKPGGHALVWALPRTSHWTALALEEAGFEVRDCVYHVFGCLSEDTEILTEAGWTKYTALKVGQLALCHDIVKGTWTWGPIEEVFVYPYAETAYRIHGASTDQIVSKNHRCPVIREGKLSFEPAETLKGDERVPVPSVLELGCIVDTLTPGDKIYRKPMVGDVVDMLLLLATPVKVEPVPYEGIVWCVRVPTGAFVARRAGKAFVTGNSGFPKSLSLEKATQKRVQSRYGDKTCLCEDQSSDGGLDNRLRSYDDPSFQLDPNRRAARRVGLDDFGGRQDPVARVCSWCGQPDSKWLASVVGWGSALKPAVECWWLCRKPIEEGTVAAQVLKTGTGALNIDATRVKHASPEDLAKHQAGVTALKEKGGKLENSWKNSSDLSGANDVKQEGRWPAQLLLSHVQYVWYALRQDVPGEVVQAIHAYYGVDEALRTSGLSQRHSGDAITDSEPQVLLAGMLRIVSAGASGADLGVPDMSEPVVQSTVQGDSRVGTQRASEVLLEEVSRQGWQPQEASGGDSPYTRNQAEAVPSAQGTVHDGEVLSVEGGQVHVSGRLPLRHDRGSLRGGSDSRHGHDQERVHSGASTGEGSGSGASADQGRAGTPSERHQRRQQARESHSRDAGEAQQDTQGSGSGAVPSPRRKPRLEVTLGVIPYGWYSYFVAVAVTGCKKVGVKVVKAPTINRFTDGMKPFGEGAGHPYESSGGGTEEQEVWECTSPSTYSYEVFTFGDMVISPAIDSLGELLEQVGRIRSRLLLASDNHTGGTGNTQSNAFESVLQGSSPQDSMGGCPVCFRFYGEQLQLVEAASRSSALQLAGALGYALDHAHSLSHTPASLLSDPRSTAGVSLESSAYWNTSSSRTCSSSDGDETGPHTSDKALEEQPRRHVPSGTLRNRKPSGVKKGSSPLAYSACTGTELRLFVHEVLLVASRYLLSSVAHKSITVQGCPVKAMDAQSGASRFFQVFEPEVPFFYTAKAARSEKEDGLEEFGNEVLLMELRSDLTEEERQYVFAELAAAGVSS